MFANVTTAIASSSAITLALFYVMNLLISIQPGAIVEPRERFEVPWIRIGEPDDPPATLQQKPDKEFIEAPQPPINTAPSDPLGGERIAVTRHAPPPVSGYKGAGTLGVDGPLVTLVRPQPVYPARPLQQGLEGWVLVEFDVQPDGTVANVRIVDSSDRAFERAALKAAQRFRFKPRVVDGVALPSPGIQNLFRFEIEAD